MSAWKDNHLPLKTKTLCAKHLQSPLINNSIFQIYKFYYTPSEEQPVCQISLPPSPGNPFSDALFTSGKQHFMSFAQIADNYHMVKNMLASFAFPL